VAQRPEKELQVALDQLSDAGLLFCRGTAPHTSCLFKHALVQDAAYSTLLRGRLQELHARAAAALEEHFADLVERQPELLAHHLTAAGDTERAVDQWLKAGQHAAERSAHREAIGHFNRGLTTLGSLPETPERDRQEVELRLANGVSLIAANGFASPDAAEAYTRARDLCERRGDTYRLLIALFGLWNFARTSDFDEARALSHRMLVLTRDHDDSGLRLQAHHAAWTTNFFRGELFPGRSQCEEGRRLYDFERHRSHAMLYGGHDPGVCARIIGGFTNWLIGYPDQSLASGNDALSLAERLGHPFTLGITLLQATVLHQLRREPGMVLQRVHAAEVVAAEQRLSLHIDSRVLRGGALAAQGAGAEAVAMIREGLSERNRAGAKLYRPFCLAVFAEALEATGDHDSALAALSEALAVAQETGERWWEAEIHRLKGVSLLSQNCLTDSEASFQRSMRIAQAQQAKSLELRAVRDLAWLWGEQGRHAEARDLLAPVRGWFTEGFDTADLKQAKALLDELT
jgi:predicted ATPase